MDRWRGRVALVTGASAGIGAAVALSLVRIGLTVLGCARRVEKVQALAAHCSSASLPGLLLPHRCDVTNGAELLGAFARAEALGGGASREGAWPAGHGKEEEQGAWPAGRGVATGRGGRGHGVDVCVSAAGHAHGDSLLRGDVTAWREMLEVNVLALSVCARESCRSMRERGIDDGHVIHISSLAAHCVLPTTSLHFYTATKHAVRSLTEGLRQELRKEKSRIRVSSISPGLVETEFAYRLHRTEPHVAASLYSNIKCLQPQDIADAVLYILSTPPHVQVGDVVMRPTDQIP